MRQELTQARLKELLSYDPETGVFLHRTPRGRRKVGDPCGTPGAAGYTALRVQGRNYRRHRLAWLYVTGSWPEVEIDHRNGDRRDDRFHNLRACTRAENQQNRASARKSASPYLGVSRSPSPGRWRAQIKVGGDVRALGTFDTEEEAHQAYLTAKAQLHTFQPTPRITTT